MQEKTCSLFWLTSAPHCKSRSTSASPSLILTAIIKGDQPLSSLSGAVSLGTATKGSRDGLYLDVGIEALLLGEHQYYSSLVRGGCPMKRQATITILEASQLWVGLDVALDVRDLFGQAQRVKTYIQ
jgi:hypothetical protein